jgi:hypothetical protein
MIEVTYHEPTASEYRTMVRNLFKTVEKPLTDGQVAILDHLDVFESARLQSVEPGDVVSLVLENWQGIFCKENARNTLAQQ